MASASRAELRAPHEADWLCNRPKSCRAELALSEKQFVAPTAAAVAAAAATTASSGRASAAVAVPACYCERLRSSGFDFSKLFSMWATTNPYPPYFGIIIERVSHGTICNQNLDLYPATRDFLTQILYDVPRALKPLKKLDEYDDANHDKKHRVGSFRANLKLDFEDWSPEPRDAFYMRDQIEKLQTVLEMRLTAMQHPWPPRLVDKDGYREPDADVDGGAEMKRNADIAWIAHLVCKIDEYRKKIDV